MEIVILLLVLAAAGAFWYVNRPSTEELFKSTPSTQVDLNTPPERDAYSPVATTQVKSTEPAKKPRKPRVKKETTTKPAKKPAALKTTRVRTSKKV